MNVIALQGQATARHEIGVRLQPMQHHPSSPHRQAQPFQPRWCLLPGVQAVEAASSLQFGRHTHDQFGIGVVLRGAQDSASGRGPVRAMPGNLISVNPNEVHDGRPVAGAPRSWRMLYFEPGLIAGLAQQMELSAGSEWIHPVLDHPQAAQAFLRLYAMLTTPGPESTPDTAEQELFQALAPLLGHAPATQAHLLSKELAQAKARIDAQPHQPVSLAELAADAGLSRFHFLRAFKAATQLPPHAYRQQRQLQMARRLILAGHGVAQAALQAGFADQSHLTRRFTAAYGLTPGAMARLCRA